MKAETFVPKIDASVSTVVEEADQKPWIGRLFG